MRKEKAKYQLTQKSIKEFPVYFCLSSKTQMIRNAIGDNSFLNRFTHTKYVKKTALLILDSHKLKCAGVDRERLICSALLHDVGHTPFGHAGEDIINDLFLSGSTPYYLKTGPGIFKHNINSIKIIGDYFQIENKRYDHVLIDSILKHSSVFPKKYNYAIFSESNIIESNYIFDRVKLTKSSFVNTFATKFIELTGMAMYCESRSKMPASDRTICYSCNKRRDKQCQCFFDGESRSQYNLSMYLSYPYPLTCEGTVLYWADEIACLCGDLFDLCRYLRILKKDLPEFILYSRLRSMIHLLLTRFESNNLLKVINECLELVNDNSLLDVDFNKKCRKLLFDEDNLMSLRNLLISALDTTDVVDNEITIKFDGINCSLLFEMDDETSVIVSAIKNAIYQDVHTTIIL